MRNVVLILILFLKCLCFSEENVYARSQVYVWQGDDYAKVFGGQNKQYVICEELNLEGKTIKIGEGCTLAFRGGSISNGTVVGNNTLIDARNYEIFKRGYIRYRAYIGEGASKGAPPTLIKQYHNCLIIDGTWSNKKCETNWTGLQNQSDEDAMLSIKNYILLHSVGSIVKFPSVNVLGYETTWIPNGYNIDFNNSTISYPDDLSIWEDKTIGLPPKATPCVIESGYGLISLRSNTTISNLTIDCKSNSRQNETIRLGVSCAIVIGSSANVVLENVHLKNTLGPGVTVHAGARDISIKDCSFNNIGEHIFYSHQYIGYCHFEDCTFDTWDSERLSVFRKGLNYLYKFAPPIDNDGLSYDDVYSFELSFFGCNFNNPLRVDSNGRTLGGFFTGYFPMAVTVDHCKFTGAPMPFNPGNSTHAFESTGMPARLIVKNCDGAPYAYPAKTNYNIIAEFYNSINIPFRTVYAKRYDNCNLRLDYYEVNNENVSPTFENEFSDTLIIKDCNFSDEGIARVCHPVKHRPVLFERCRFKGGAARRDVASLLSIQSDNILSVSFLSCDFNMPKLRLIDGNRPFDNLTVQSCVFESIMPKPIISKPKQIKLVYNRFCNNVLETSELIQMSEKQANVIFVGNKDEKGNLIDLF